MFEKRDLEYHPVLLRESAGHYNGNNNIIQFEQVSTIAGAIGACHYNIIKYANRNNGQDELDAKKIETFKGWYELLKDLLEMGYSYEDNLRYAMICEYPNMKYTL